MESESAESIEPMEPCSEGTLESRIENHENECCEDVSAKEESEKIASIKEYSRSKSEKTYSKSKKYESDGHHETREKESANPYLRDRKGARTLHGSLAIIYHEDHNTGEVEFYFEVKRPDYPLPEQRGKFQNVGGAMDTTDNSFLETMVRELWEEPENKEAARILISNLKKSVKSTDDFIFMTREYLNGNASDTYFYEINVKDLGEWSVVKSSALEEGNTIVLTKDEILRMGPDVFAFNNGEVIFQFIHNKYVDKKTPSTIKGKEYWDCNCRLENISTKTPQISEFYANRGYGYSKVSIQDYINTKMPLFVQVPEFTVFQKQ